MENFIEVWTENARAFLNKEEISRISFSKEEGLRQSERRVKVQFKDGSTGTYIGHRTLEAAFARGNRTNIVEEA